MDGDWEHLVIAVRGTVPLSGEEAGDLNIGHTIASEVKHASAHFYPSRELGDRVDLHFDLDIGYSATTPDDADEGDIVFTAVEHHLFDETPQQRLALSI